MRRLTVEIGIFSRRAASEKLPALTTFANTTREFRSIMGRLIDRFGRHFARNGSKPRRQASPSEDPRPHSKLCARARSMPIADALRNAKVVVLAIHFQAIKEFMTEHREELVGKIIVDP